MHVLIAGCGWLGGAVAQYLVARGDRVTGIRTDPRHAKALEASRVTPLILDLADPACLAQLPPDVDAILALQSAKGEGEESYRRAYLAANRTLLEVARRRPLRAFVYTGSTGLFGQRDGAEVDEDTPPAPANPAGHILAEAEELLLTAANEGIPVRIVRLSGLYGPGRVWMIDRLRQGLMTLGSGDEAWMNSCHRDDAVQIVLAALDKGRNGAVYHGTHAGPMRRREVIRFISQRLEMAPSTAEAGFEGPNRRISGERSRREFGLEVRWPTLREGLAPYLDNLRGGQAGASP